MSGSNTLVLQSHSSHAPGWVVVCTASVRRWAESQDYDYRCLGDELFCDLPEGYRQRVAGRSPILADLARLQQAQRWLERFEVVVWLDADVLIWAPRLLGAVVVEDALFGREQWVALDAKGRWRVRSNLHNAFCAFRRGSVVLPFLARATRQVIERADPRHIAPQMVGPKLIGALHNIAGFEVSDAIGACSPAVLDDLEAGDGPALARLLEMGGQSLAGANLCTSLVAERDLTALCTRLVRCGSISP